MFLSSCKSRSLGAVSLLTLLAVSPAAIAAPAEARIAFAIPAGPLESALTAYAQRANIQLLYTPDLVRGRHSAGLMGEYSARAALDRLLAGTSILVEETKPGVFVLRTGVVATPLTDVQSEVAATSSLLDEVVVTGTHIRGVGAGPSPVVVVDRDEIDRQGFATLADTLAALPQNYAGLATPDATATGADTTSQNAGRATTINLRGLGPDATLVLVNGRRLAGGGGRGDLSDLSSLSTAAIERVDILLDGASALYGSDAVGGVVNIVLRRDFDGAETRLRVGGAEGGAREVQVAQTLGAGWTSGSMTGSYEYYHRQALPFSARDFTASADLRAFGGADRRSFNASPGNILGLDPATGLTAPLWAIPAGATSFPLAPSAFQRGVVNLTSPRAGMDLMPEQSRHAVYLSGEQRIGDSLKLNADLRYSQRIAESASQASTATIVIGRNNPFFASPNGAATHQIAYSFLDALGNPRATSRVDSLGVSAGLVADLFGDWQVDGHLAYAQELTKAVTRGVVNSAFLREAVGAIADNPATAYAPASDGYFNPYGANASAVLGFIGAGYNRQRFKGETASFNLQVDGSALDLPGGVLKVAVGLAGRQERFGQYTESFTSAIAPTFVTPATLERQVAAAFVELRAPIIGEANALPGVRRLDLSVAGRIERYDDAGTTRNPKIGLTWTPTEGVLVRGTWGTSFRAPLLAEISGVAQSAASPVPYRGGQIVGISLVGGNRDLKPETATSWTIGLDWTPAQVQGLRLSATVFDTDFKDQVDRPTTRFIPLGVDHPAVASFVRFIDPAKPADLAYVQSLISAPGYLSGTLYPASAIGVVVDSRYVNTGRIHVRGMDLNGRYRFSKGRDDFEFTAAISYLSDYELQVTPTSPVTNYVDVAGLPVDLRGRATVSWRRGDVGVLAGLNYVDDSRSDAGKTVSAWTTMDLQLRWRPSHPRLKGLDAIVSAQNVFGQDPPFFDAPAGVGYDAANADPLGRFVSLQLTKRW